MSTAGADLAKADLSNANLKGVTGITVEELEKQAKSLKGAIMPDGKIYRNSSGANLREAFLSGVDLSEANLSGANLSGAVLIKANLSHAILFNADLSNAILEGTNFNKAWVTKEQLAQAKSLQGATMPDGKKLP